MKKKFFAGVVVGLLMLGATSNAHSSMVFFDGDFDDSEWNHTVYVFGGGGTQTDTQYTTGGNPDSYLYIDTTVNSSPNSWVEGVFLKQDAIYTPSFSGAVGTIDYSEDARCYYGGGRDGQAAGLVIQQNQNLYFMEPYFTTQFSSWTHLNRSGLVASDFWYLDIANNQLDSTLNPDFSIAGSTMTFGFHRGNSTLGGGYSIGAGIDNWQITVNPVPLPPTVLLFGTCMAGLVGVRLTRKKQ